MDSDRQSDGRVRFTQSRPCAENDAINVLSYEPATSAQRFERGLFLQAAGIPAFVCAQVSAIAPVPPAEPQAPAQKNRQTILEHSR